MLANKSVNPGAHRVWTAVLAALPLAAGLTGCIVVDDDDPYYYDDPPVVDDDIATVGIDEGATLDAEPGVGAGVFIEYLGFGEWSIWTTCDTERTGYSCEYDVFVSAEGLDYVTDSDLEGGDYLDVDFERAHAELSTDYDFDGFTFETFEGEPVLIEVWLDGVPDGSLVFWVENGDIWQGLPTNPTWFVP